MARRHSQVVTKANQTSLTRGGVLAFLVAAILFAVIVGAALYTRSPASASMSPHPADHVAAPTAPAASQPAATSAPEPPSNGSEFSSHRSRMKLRFRPMRREAWFGLREASSPWARKILLTWIKSACKPRQILGRFTESTWTAFSWTKQTSRTRNSPSS